MVRIHSIETLGAHDGPGIRTVVFFQGCYNRCWYCHNADTFDLNAGKEMLEEEIAAFCAKYKNYYGSEGGATLSGGEPLVQARAAEKLLSLLKKENIGTALDTSGTIFCPSVLLKADLVILDIKHTDEEKFKELTGVPMENTLKTLRFLQENKKRFWIRQVILPSFNDTSSQIEALKKMSEGAERIELLPYHSMGEGKWEKCGLQYKLKGVLPPDKEKMKELNDILAGAFQGIENMRHSLKS